MIYAIELDNGYPQCRETRYFEANPNDPGAVEETAGEVFAAYMEEYEYVEEGLRALHSAERGRIPAACRLHKVFDGREDVHENV